MQGVDIKSEFRTAIKMDKRWSGALRLGNLPRPIRKVSELLAYTGDSKLWWPILVLVWFLGNTFWKQWTVAMILGLALGAVVIWPIKHLVNRRRPMGHWGKRTRERDPDSFPSGHATRSFLLAILAIGLGPLWVAALLSIWAPFAALARVAVGMHYLSDVVAGMLLAVAVGVAWLFMHEGALQLLDAASVSLLHFPLW